MNVLKIATAGSVDDGKSTLIGRLLYDTKSLPTDKLEAIESSSQKRGLDYLDFSLVTDGLVAEREQGITIDVAHIYFSTAQRSYIIADAPGHIEYTRNMVTGASTSNVSIILIDARKGVVEQTYRHFFINDLLRTQKVIVAVNKMDLVGYNEAKFNAIKTDVQALIEKSDYNVADIEFIPISALKGDNIASNNFGNTPWYTGESLLDQLEKTDLSENNKALARFPIQQVLKGGQDQPLLAGKLNGSSIKVGDKVTLLPSNVNTEVASIEFFDEKYEEAKKGASVNISLKDEVAADRGNMLVKTAELPKVNDAIEAKICWMDAEALKEGAQFTIQHGLQRVPATVKSINKIIKPDFSGEETGVEKVALNEIADVSLDLRHPIFYDVYKENPENGAFIFINEHSHNTSGVGFIQ